MTEQKITTLERNTAAVVNWPTGNARAALSVGIDGSVVLTLYDYSGAEAKAIPLPETPRGCLQFGM
jgi:hypothetical protein